MARTYLDWAAGAPPLPDILETADRIAMEYYANPSSPHAEGRAAEGILSDSRRRLAAAIGIDPASLLFTSGGTESNNIVLSSFLARISPGELVVSGIEHSSVYEPITYLQSQGIRVTWIPAEKDGRVSPDKVAAALTPDTTLVVVMQVNNETGAIQPIAEIAGRIRDHERRTGKSIHFHCDAVQALGKIPADYHALDVDSASFSAHKIGGPRGVGALYLRKPLPVLFRGGGQEGNRRPGTENLAAIWAMTEATVRAMRDMKVGAAHAEELKKLLAAGMRHIDGVCFVPESAAVETERFSPYILSVAFPPLPGEVLVRALNDSGYAISTGSACSSKHHKERRILMNMGLDEDTARSSVRISVGVSTTEEEVLRFVDSLAKEVRRWNMPARA